LLEKHLKRILRSRLIEERDGYRLYRLEDRNLFFRPEQEKYQIRSCDLSISDILMKEVEEKLDGT